MLKIKKMLLLFSIVTLIFNGLYSSQQPVQGGEQAKKGKLININNASLEELTTLPRIGIKIAQRIIDFRKKNGNFKRIEDLMKVKGIGEKLFARIRNQISV